jgi:hypothetical protein
LLIVVERLASAPSLATWELHVHGTNTRLVLTEHGTFLNGYVDGGSRVTGSTLLLDMLGAALTKESTAV